VLHEVGMCKSVQGLTMAELLITMATLSVVLVRAYRSFLSSSKHLVLGLLGGLPVAVPRTRPGVRCTRAVRSHLEAV